MDQLAYILERLVSRLLRRIGAELNPLGNVSVFVPVVAGTVLTWKYNSRGKKSRFRRLTVFVMIVGCKFSIVQNTLITGEVVIPPVFEHFEFCQELICFFISVSMNHFTSIYRAEHSLSWFLKCKLMYLILRCVSRSLKRGCSGYMKWARSKLYRPCPLSGSAQVLVRANFLELLTRTREHASFRILQPLQNCCSTKTCSSTKHSLANNRRHGVAILSFSAYIGGEKNCVYFRTR